MRWFLLGLAISAQAADVDWLVNGGAHNIRYTTLSQISPTNIARLQVAWTYDAHDAPPLCQRRSRSCNPASQAA